MPAAPSAAKAISRIARILFSSVTADLTVSTSDFEARGFRLNVEPGLMRDYNADPRTVARFHDPSVVGQFATRKGYGRWTATTEGTEPT
jgi:hypothetical protein